MLVVGLVQRIDFGGLDITYKSITNPYVQSTLTPHRLQAQNTGGTG